MARGFLPQGLSNTCPQTGALRSVVASRGQVSNKPKRKRSFAEHAEESKFVDSSRSRVPTGEPVKITASMAASNSLELALPTHCCLTPV